MNSPNESIDMSAAADEYTVDIDDSALASIDLRETVAEHPMTSALMAAAAGAGMMALLSLTMRSGRSSSQVTAPAVTAPSLPDVATRNDLADLRDQVSRWLNDISDAAPSRGDVKRNVEDATDSVVNTWNEVRDQATELAQRVKSQVGDTADRLRPKLNAAVELAKDNPMWLGVAIAAIGALVGASALAKTRR